MSTEVKIRKLIDEWDNESSYYAKEYEAWCRPRWKGILYQARRNVARAKRDLFNEHAEQLRKIIDGY